MAKKPHVKCYGLSLGGALAYHLGKEFGPRVQINAYVPPGLFINPDVMRRIHGVAYYHVDDFVASLGYHPTGDHFISYGVITAAKRNFLVAHARPVGCNPTLVIEINPLHENSNFTRHILTIGKHILSIFLYIVTLPVMLIIEGVLWIRKQ
jgi:hypothetical protein